MTPEDLLRQPDRVRCTPFPHQDHGMAMEANISPRQCLTNQVAGKMPACRDCVTGRRVKKAHPEIKAKVIHPYTWGNPSIRKPA
jgi:hypothetical protein